MAYYYLHNLIIAHFKMKKELSCGMNSKNSLPRETYLIWQWRQCLSLHSVKSSLHSWKTLSCLPSPLFLVTRISLQAGLIWVLLTACSSSQSSISSLLRLQSSCSSNLSTKYPEISLLKRKKRRSRYCFSGKSETHCRTKTINQNFNPGKGTADQSAVPLYNHVIFRIVAATRAIAAMTSHISVIFHTNLTHL